MDACWKPRFHMPPPAWPLQARASNSETPGPSKSGLSWEAVLGNAIPAVALVALIYYAAQLAPNQTPLRDTYAPIPLYLY